ncbi:MAG: amidase [Gemmatimonadaceae bacterium]
MDTHTMDRRTFLYSGAISGVAAVAGSKPGKKESLERPVEPRRPVLAPPQAELDEITVTELQKAMESGRYSARSVAELYLRRIEEVDRKGPALKSVIEVNPDALAIAESLDNERRNRSGGTRGPLHGIPVLIKDNIDTADNMRTSAGSLALAESVAARDAFIARKLREAGAVILGKTNLSEWANFRSTHSSSGWSARGGQTRNPYALDRNPCGSSSGSGSASAANLATLAIGTETDGSIVCPASACGLVGVKPTVGLVSRSGIIPISHSQDTAGPMTRTVSDAAALLGVIAGFDPADSATSASRGRTEDYTRFLDAAGLKGARLGIARNFFGFNDRVDGIMSEAIAAMKNAGAVIVDPANFPTRGQFDDSEFEVLLFEFKHDLNAYLSKLGTATSALPRSLADLIEFNDRNAPREMPYFGQEIFLRAQKKGPLTSSAYKKALARNHLLSRARGIDALVAKHKLDAIVAPTGGPAWTTDVVNGDHFSGGSSTAAAVAGYPAITVPAGFVYGLPVGITFFGKAWTEPKLFRVAYAFEQATKVRKAPAFLPTADLGL